MPVESGGRPQPFRPAFQRLDAGSGGAAGGNRERRGGDLSGRAVMPPLVVNLVRLMEQERQKIERRGSTEFYPPFWMYDKIGEMVVDYSPFWRREAQSEEGRRGFRETGIDPDTLNLREGISDEGLQERQQFFSDIATAYGIAVYEQFTPRQKNRFRQVLRRKIAVLNIGNVTLNEHQRQVLTQIAAATQTPVNPEQETYHFYTILQQPDITKEEMRQDPRYFTW